jgi:hypothetical protein
VVFLLGITEKNRTRQYLYLGLSVVLVLERMYAVTTWIPNVAYIYL